MSTTRSSTLLPDNCWSASKEARKETVEEGEVMSPLTAPLPRVAMKRTSRSLLDGMTYSSVGHNTASRSARQGSRPRAICDRCGELKFSPNCCIEITTLSHTTSGKVRGMIGQYTRRNMPRKTSIRDTDYHCIQLNGKVVAEYCNRCKLFHKEGPLMHATEEHDRAMRVLAHIMKERKEQASTTEESYNDHEEPGYPRELVGSVGFVSSSPAAASRRNEDDDCCASHQSEAATEASPSHKDGDICRVVSWEPPRAITRVSVKTKADQDESTCNTVTATSSPDRHQRVGAIHQSDDASTNEREEPAVASGSSLNSKLLFSSKFSDLQFLCSDGKRFPAHKNILAAASPTIAALLELDAACSTMHLAYPSKVVEAALRAIYEAPLDPSVFEEHLDACLFFCSAYQLKSFQKHIHHYLLTKLTIGNLKRALQQAKKTKDAYLWKGCLKFVSQHRVEVLASPSISCLATEDLTLWKSLVEAPSHIHPMAPVAEQSHALAEDGNKRRRVSIDLR